MVSMAIAAAISAPCSIHSRVLPSSSSSSSRPGRIAAVSPDRVNSGARPVLAIGLAISVWSRRRSSRCQRHALELGDWLSKVSLHKDLSKDIEDSFGHVPQQAAQVIDDAVARIEQGARFCVAPVATAHPFGSTVNGFGEASSDLDVLIAVDEEELCYYMSYINWHQWEQRTHELMDQELPLQLPEMPRPAGIDQKAAMSCAIRQLAEFLPELGFKVVRYLPQARKPLVTLEDSTGQLECDLSINNRLPLCNTELLSASFSAAREGLGKEILHLWSHRRQPLFVLLDHHGHLLLTAHGDSAILAKLGNIGKGGLRVRLLGLEARF